MHATEDPHLTTLILHLTVRDQKHTTAFSDCATLNRCLHLTGSIPCPQIVFSHHLEESVHKLRLACEFGVTQLARNGWTREYFSQAVEVSRSRMCHSNLRDQPLQLLVGTIRSGILDELLEAARGETRASHSVSNPALFLGRLTSTRCRRIVCCALASWLIDSFSVSSAIVSHPSAFSSVKFLCSSRSRVW
ncbi:hypothetical protein KC341_g4 [Hortaea werneckii]|nr:hypothetical protein KC341_g4 [Hortaea werneckii]